MGYILSDHRGTVDPTGTKDGMLEEWDTIGCVHCNAVIKIIISGCTRNYDTRFSCLRCRKPICRLCAEAMAVTHQCPGPVRVQVERALVERDALRSITNAF